MNVSLDLVRENHDLREQIAMKDEVIDSMLEAPYRGMTAWAISLACSHRKHPTKPNGDTCYCGKRSDPVEGGA